MRNLKIFLILFPCLCFGSWQAQTEDEALFLRRIADFWQEGEYLVAKAQIEEFLNYYPGSAFADTLRAALGDLLLREKNYSDALNRYTQIASTELAKRSFLNRMQCLYHLGWYATLADSCEKALEDGAEDPHQKLQTTYFLAIALYQQCLNSAKEPETLPKLALRASPYFQTLFESELSGEVAQAFAHLCCILKDYPKAAKIILDQAKKIPEAEEELLFQAALIQAEYDKKLAISTFSEIANTGKAKAQDAAYNCLVLSFDAGHYDELVSNKQEFLKKIPEEKSGLAHLFLGRSYFALKNYPAAVVELKTYLSSESNGSSEFERGALLSLLDSSFHAEDFSSFEWGLKKLLDAYPFDPEAPNAYFTRAKLLRKIGDLENAREALENHLTQFTDFPQNAQILFELIQIDHQSKKWEGCYEQSTNFIDRYGSKHELSSYAWRYLLSSLMEMGAKEALIEKLKTATQNEILFNETERAEWKFLLAKTHFELSQFDQAKAILTSLLEAPSRFQNEANAQLLLAFCVRDGDRDLEKFCHLTEEAMEKKANLIEPGSLHSALFNAYLQTSAQDPERIDQAERHLYAAFEKGAKIESQNLLWLSERFYESSPEKAALILDRSIKETEDLQLAETLVCKRAKIHQFLGEHKEAAALLESATNGHKEKEEAKLLLAESLSALGEKQRAIQLIDEILSSAPSLRSETAASASLLRSRQRIENWRMRKGDKADPEIHKAIVELKNLILQRQLSHEPLHLEAALDYVALQTELDLTRNRPEKNLSLLLKVKADFESSGDLLSKDYHESRAKLPQKNRILEGYLRLIDAEIFIAQAQINLEPDSQNKLQAKAKELLLQIVDDSIHPRLVERARMQLEKTDAQNVSISQIKK